MTATPPCPRRRRRSRSWPTCLPPAVLGNVHETIGWTHYYMGDYVAALDHMTQALRVAEEIGDRSLQAYALDRIACVHASAGHLDVARDAHERALAIHRELGDAMGEALALNNIAYTYLDLGDPDAALAAAEAALDYCEAQEPHFLLMGVLDTLAEIHMRTGDLERGPAVLRARTGSRALPRLRARRGQRHDGAGQDRAQARVPGRGSRGDAVEPSGWPRSAAGPSSSTSATCCCRRSTSSAGTPPVRSSTTSSSTSSSRRR